MLPLNEKDREFMSTSSATSLHIHWLNPFFIFKVVYLPISIFLGGWYEGEATFLNCSHLIDGKEQAYISWGSSKAWQSNAVPVWANPWNITYNGDTFGFEPYHNGKYIFKVYSSMYLNILNFFNGGRVH